MGDKIELIFLQIRYEQQLSFTAWKFYYACE
jgi:hypothetical protein